MPLEPPQQLSGKPGHPWFDPYWGSRVRVLLNGIERSHVVVADGPGRYIERYTGEVDREAGELVTERLEGDVVVVRREEE